MGEIQSAAVLTVDTIFTWQPNGYSIDCQCRLRIYKLSFDTAIVIVSTLPEDSSLALNGMMLELIHVVCYRFGLAPNKTMWIEHDPGWHPNSQEKYYEIILIWNEANWQKSSKEKIEQLLGQPL